ncbi:hypothetical protein EZV62_011313 [Acer yangbiense]|uniref:Uncharacterized protein n=1 Tax=Acer yangbiense TaxID=1000413 RepID=A0A5C7I634_9ROSI|nr:hypothetical protein EZV62_011313 [Acer yangbiense]
MFFHDLPSALLSIDIGYDKWCYNYWKFVKRGRVGLAIVTTHYADLTTHYGCVGIFIGNFTTYLSNSVGEILSEESQSHSMANNGEDVSYVPWVQTSKDTVDLCGMRVEEAAHQLTDMVISGADSQSCLCYGWDGHWGG